MPNAKTDHPTTVIGDPCQLTELVTDTRQTNGPPIVDYGIAHSGLGHPPPPVHTRLIQTGTVIDYDDRDLVVRTAAGTTMGDLQSVLRQANQFFPVDADHDLTVGEVILHNVYGPLRVAYGSVSDLLLGLRYVDGLGRDVHVGGRTVKNVAGYDVTHFLVGSLGELGCVYEATLRTSVIPESVLSVQVHVEDPNKLDHCVTDLLTGDAWPTHMSLQSQRGTHILHLGFFGHPEGYPVQLRGLQSWIDRIAGVQLTETQVCSLDQDTQQRTDRRRWRRQASGLVKLIVPPAQSGVSCQACSDWASTDHRPLTIDCLPVHGCLFIGGPLDAQACQRLDEQVRQVADAVGGMRVWYARPGLTPAIAPFAPTGPDWALLGRVKQALDPLGLFNPGRFLPWPPPESDHR